jgi:hypothetical protein
MLSSEQLQCTACGNVEKCDNAMTETSFGCVNYVARVLGDVDTSWVRPWVQGHDTSDIGKRNAAKRALAEL